MASTGGPVLALYMGDDFLTIIFVVMMNWGISK